MVRVGVTGHRILTQTKRIDTGIDAVLAAIGSKFPGATLCLLSPLAEGTDRLVARRVLQRPNSRLVFPLPLPRDEFERDFTSAESTDEFRRLLDRADEVIELPAQGSRSEAYRAAGMYVLDRCDTLIAVWDGQEENETGKVVAEARRRKLPIAWIHAGNRDPQTNRPTSLGDEQGRVTFENFPT